MTATAAEEAVLFKEQFIRASFSPSSRSMEADFQSAGSDDDIYPN